jgi:hypothetical protein
LAVSWRRRLQGLAWVATAGALVTAAAVVVATAELGPVTFFLVLLGVATLWFGYAFEWTLLRWPVAIVADLAVLILSLRAVAPAASDTPGIAFSAQVVLLVAYLGSFATRTLVLNRNVAIEVVQSIAAILSGLVEPPHLRRRQRRLCSALQRSRWRLGAMARPRFVERRQSRRRNYYFYTSAALFCADRRRTDRAVTNGRPRLRRVRWLGDSRTAVRRFTCRSHATVYLMAGVLATD